MSLKGQAIITMIIINVIFSRMVVENRTQALLFTSQIDVEKMILYSIELNMINIA